MDYLENQSCFFQSEGDKDFDFTQDEHESTTGRSKDEMCQSESASQHMTVHTYGERPSIVGYQSEIVEKNSSRHQMNSAEAANLPFGPRWRIRLLWGKGIHDDESVLIVPEGGDIQTAQDILSLIKKNAAKQGTSFIEEMSGKHNVWTDLQDFYCIYFVTNLYDSLELDQADFIKLRNLFCKVSYPFYIGNYHQTFEVARNSARSERKNLDEMNVFSLENFQLDLIKMGIQKQGRFILHEKKIIGKRVVAYQIMKTFKHDMMKIVIIANKKNTHHWKELISQWEPRMNKRSIFLYKKDNNRLSNLQKKEVIIVNDAQAKDFLDKASQGFIKCACWIIDRDLKHLEVVCEKLQYFAVRICHLCPGSSDLKPGERLTLLNLFDKTKTDFAEDSVTRSDVTAIEQKRSDASLNGNNSNLNKYFLMLDEKKIYPEFDFKVHEKAFIVSHHEHEFEPIKKLKNLVANGSPQEIQSTYMQLFNKSSEDILKMSQNLKGNFKNKESYFYHHGQESMKRAIDFHCARLFGDVKLRHVKPILEQILAKGHKKIVIWAFHREILQKLAALVKELPQGESYPLLEISSETMDEKRHETISQFNKQEKGFIIIPFSVKKERFKNLVFDVFLFIELTYNLEYFSSARKILYAPYMTKDKHLYLILSQAADNYIWIKFESMYKRPEWERHTRELRETGQPFLVYDLVIKDEKSRIHLKPLRECLEHLTATNENLRHDIRKSNERLKDLKEKRKATKKNTCYEVDTIITSLTDGPLFTEEELNCCLTYNQTTTRINNTVYKKMVNGRLKSKLIELQNRQVNFELLDVHENLKHTLRKVRSQSEAAFTDVFVDSLEQLSAPDISFDFIDRDFDMAALSEEYESIKVLFGSKPYGEFNQQAYTEAIEYLGYDVSAKDPTQSARSAHPPARNDWNEDNEAFEEWTSMLMATYFAILTNNGQDTYSKKARSDVLTFEQEFVTEVEHRILHAVILIRNQRDYSLLAEVLSLFGSSAPIADLIVEGFKTKIESMSDEPHPVYQKIDFADKFNKYLKKDTDCYEMERFKAPVNHITANLRPRTKHEDTGSRPLKREPKDDQMTQLSEEYMVSYPVMHKVADQTDVGQPIRLQDEDYGYYMDDLSMPGTGEPDYTLGMHQYDLSHHDRAINNQTPKRGASHFPSQNYYLGKRENDPFCDENGEVPFLFAEDADDMLDYKED